jgi:hypothetical protein
MSRRRTPLSRAERALVRSQRPDGNPAVGEGTAVPARHAHAPLNECPTCGLDFASLSAFDQHRVGKYPQTGPAEYRDRLARRLVPTDEDWRPEFGRRCLDEFELRERGFRVDMRGRWRRPASGRVPWMS